MQEGLVVVDVSWHLLMRLFRFLSKQYSISHAVWSCNSLERQVVVLCDVLCLYGSISLHQAKGASYCIGCCKALLVFLVCGVVCHSH